MKILHYVSLSIILIAVSCMNNASSKTQSQAAKVELVKQGNQYTLLKNGEPFYISGAGLEFGNIEKLAKSGANSFRTWRTDNGQKTGKEILDEAQKHGLMVLMGIEIGRERHGYDYNDSVWVKQQFDFVKGEVLKYKDHPALLAWGIGNELNLHSTNMKIWNAVNTLSKMIHEVDPNHPTTTMLAGIGEHEVSYINEHCSDLDFLCIQMYGDIVNLQEKIKAAGYQGPYIVTEWGATGHWEVALTEWGAPIEQTSKEKAEVFRYRYNKAIASDPDKCLGSYVFLWGQKQERTPTWYGMFLENNYKTETVDAMYYIWNNKWPEYRCPALDSLHLNAQTAHNSIKVAANEACIAEVFINPNGNDSLTYLWEIIPESMDQKDGGDRESRPKTYLNKQAGAKFLFTAPSTPGAYRIFSYALGEHENAATANIPFWVE